MASRYKGDRISPEEAANMLCMNAQCLRVMLQRGDLPEVGKAIPPEEGHTHYRYLIFRDNVLSFMGKTERRMTQ